MHRLAAPRLSHARFALLALGASLLFLFATPAPSQAVTAPAGAASTGGECMIEPWECEIEEPSPPEECMIEPWECGGEEPETCDGELRGYIIVFHDWVEDPSALAHEQVEKYGGTLGFVYRYALKGYSAQYSPSVIDELSAEPSVDYVEEDGIVEVFGASSVGEPESPGANGCSIEQQSTPASTSAPSSAGDAGNGDQLAAESPSGPTSVGQCRKGGAQRDGRCLHRRHLAVQVCRRREGTAQLRCRRHTVRKLANR